MSDADWAWAAGLYEGEGSCDVHSVERPDWARHYARLRIKMTDRDVLEKFRGVVGGRGSLCGPHERREPRWKPTYEWTTTNQGDVVLIVSMFWPWLCSRRRAQILRVLTETAERNGAEPLRPAVHDPDTGRIVSAAL